MERDINWLRLRDVSLSYNFGKMLSNTQTLSFIRDAQITFSARNLFLITNYKGVDLETSIAGANSNTNGFDYFNNPRTRSYTLSFKFTFNYEKNNIHTYNYCRIISQFLSA